MSRKISRRKNAPTAADRIFADGIPIILKGEAHTLRYGMRALRYLEDEFESIDEFLKRIRQKGIGKDFIRAICAGMIAGLLHEKPAEMALDVFEEQCGGRLDEGGSLSEWTFAMSHALAESFPVARPGAQVPKGKGSGRSSRGPAGTTSPPSVTAGRKRRSGR